jgi:DEAD/DEAH box helicase domain-containing protein
VLPLFALCDRNDIGGVSTLSDTGTGVPQVYIYDAYPGGVGIAELGYEMVERLWLATLSLVRECPCLDGCPSCIQSPKCGNNNDPLDKGGAIALLEALSMPVAQG